MVGSDKPYEVENTIAILDAYVRIHTPPPGTTFQVQRSVDRDPSLWIPLINVLGTQRAVNNVVYKVAGLSIAPIISRAMYPRI